MSGTSDDFLDATRARAREVPDPDTDLEAARHLAQQAREFMDGYDPGALTDDIADEMRAEGLLDGCALADAVADEMHAKDRR